MNERNLRKQIMSKQTASKRRRMADNVEIKQEMLSPQTDEEEEFTYKVSKCPYLQPNSASRQLEALETGYMTDVTVVVKNEKIRCHSLVLSFASPKLAACFTKEKELRLPDVDSRHFTLLLKIVYGGNEFHLKDLETLVGVGRIAHELQVHAGVVYCARSLEKLVSVARVFEILEFANLIDIDDTQLKDICYKVIRRDCGAVLQTKSFLKCSLDTLETILRQEELKNVSELELFMGCKNWATAHSPGGLKCNLRKVLGSALHLVRFLAMSHANFAMHVCSTGLLTVTEERDIMRCYGTDEKTMMPKEFTDETKTRNELQFKVYNLTSDIKLKSDAMKFCNADDVDVSTNALRISASVDIYILGVSFRTVLQDYPRAERYDQSIKVELKNIEGAVLTSKYTLRRVKHDDVIRVHFNSPYEIFAYDIYTIQINVVVAGKRQFYNHCKPQVWKSRNSELKINVLEKAYLPYQLSVAIAEKDQVVESIDSPNSPASTTPESNSSDGQSE